MTFGEKMKELVNQGLHASKDIATKAGAAAQELGEKGVLKLEVIQLEGQAQKLIARLGAEVYSSFTDTDAKTVSRSDTLIAGLLEELEAVKASIEKRQLEMKSK
ncbi:hypothetical protein MASR2M78_04800 [Treponema sp.]